MRGNVRFQPVVSVTNVTGCTDSARHADGTDIAPLIGAKNSRKRRWSHVPCSTHPGTKRNLPLALVVDACGHCNRSNAGHGWGANSKGAAAAAPGLKIRGQNLLLARRLVEAGVPFVNVYDFRQQGQNWDSHADNFNQHKNILLPPMDQAVSALLDDLDASGQLDETLIASVDAIITQRAQGRPVAHLVGQREFYSLPLKITAGVLIPRPETEMLVDLALSFIVYGCY